ncbi:ABC transporter substrate-binding protein [Desulfotalea psychrophila]|uniref:Related to oligopeptide ABC transporter, oligopeptide-binding protein n=1 Tax=Desulfotalea psychrophila (strain LSv54 / DSM 12343) TaxID=177439 RepID=Q6AP19_DESPS|nr:ABC transporter substrate-binding protein [Desulfotalea psychrophila]CAG35905.1 related to oligopeptide ABC transporter, oligopeptide-binding protein [Desulfotalea psychrophila LSv54]
MKRRKYTLLFMLLLAAFTIAGCKSNSEQPEKAKSVAAEQAPAVSNAPHSGGEITIALQKAPDNLDTDFGTQWEATQVMNHVYEGLFETDGNGQPQPYLAESCTLSSDSKQYEIKLRKGVKFSDQHEMKAEDVKASIDRWLRMNQAGHIVKDKVKSVDIINDYEIRITLNQIYAPILSIMASQVSGQRVYVREKKILDKFGENIITDYVGTGPYIIGEYVPGQKAVLVKNVNYTPAKGKLSGLTGQRNPYLDKITMDFVPEESVRVAGLQSGQYDFIDEVSTDQYATLSDYPGIKPIICNDGTISVIAINSAKPPFDNKRMRQALACAIDDKELAQAQIGNEKFWSVEDGSWFKKGNIWYDPNAGKEMYNVHDLARAKKLVQESGYSGETISIIGDKSNMYESNAALVLQNQLKAIGLNVSVDLYDEATAYDYETSGKWNIRIARWSDMTPDPQNFQPWTGTNGWITGWDDKGSHEMDAIFERMAVATDQKARYEIVKEFYAKFWEEVPYIKSFNDVRLYGINERVKGFQAYGQPFFWNAWVDDSAN